MTFCLRSGVATAAAAWDLERRDADVVDSDPRCVPEVARCEEHDSPQPAVVVDANALAVRDLVEPLHAIGIDARERVAIEQMAVNVTDRPQRDCTHLGVRVEDVVTVPGDRLGSSSKNISRLSIGRSVRSS